MVFMYSIMVVSLFPNSLSEGYTFVFSNLLGRLGAAPVIMFCMGVGMVYSTKSSSERMIRRGINLVILGVLVNLLQFFLPCLVTGILLGEWTIFPIAKGLMLFRVDFLAFAGMTFILMGFAQRLDLTSGALITFALFFSVVGSTLRFSDAGLRASPYSPGSSSRRWGMPGGTTIARLNQRTISSGSGQCFSSYPWLTSSARSFSKTDS